MKLKKKKKVRINMDKKYELYVEKSINELNLSKIILIISENDALQEEIFMMPEDTYYSAVITHAYYSIFYMAKAYLITKNIQTKAPEEHKKTYEEFKKIVEKGILDVELLKIYQELIIRADNLLQIFQTEKSKRGKYTYQKLPEANAEPAKESLKNAEKFFKHINKIGETTKKEIEKLK